MKNVYEVEKAAIKAKFEITGEAYPANANGLTQEFIVKELAPILSGEDLLWLIETRSECKRACKKGSNEKVANWFPAFRSKVAKQFFPEFSVRTKKVEEDEFELYLTELLKKAS